MILPNFGTHLSCLHDITGIESTSIENIGWLKDYYDITHGYNKHQLIEHNKHEGLQLIEEGAEDIQRAVASPDMIYSGHILEYIM